MPVSLDAPTFTLSHTAGFKGVLGGEYNFNLTEASIRKRFWLGSWGKLDVTARAGAQWNTVPFPLLNLPMANLSYITQNNESFNLINNMEFLNDRYASLNLSYDMNGKLFNRIPLIKKLKWREMFRIRGLWATLTDEAELAEIERILSASTSTYPSQCGFASVMRLELEDGRVLSLGMAGDGCGGAGRVCPRAARVRRRRGRLASRP